MTLDDETLRLLELSHFWMRQSRWMGRVQLLLIATMAATVLAIWRRPNEVLVLRVVPSLLFAGVMSAVCRGIVLRRWRLVQEQLHERLGI